VATALRVIWRATPGSCRSMANSAYTRLAKIGTGASNETVTLAGCWAHLRRRFYELHLNGSSRLATQTVTTMAGLWKIEGDIRGLAPTARMAARQQRSASIVAELFNLWEMELPRISGKSKLAEAIRYATSRRKVLECFLTDGRVEIDSNIVERAIRPQTITRKNALFAGSDGGGRTWATIATLLQTAKMSDVDPLAWLALTLQRIAEGWPISQIEKLMPWNYKI
jgi:transposase